MDTLYKIAVYDSNGLFIGEDVREVTSVREAAYYAFRLFRRFFDSDYPAFMRIIDTEDPYAIGTLYKLTYSNNNSEYPSTIRKTEFINH